MKYEYFVSYASGNGFGKSGITKNRRIKTISDVSEIEKALNEDLGFTCIILNYKLIRVSVK